MQMQVESKWLYSHPSRPQNRTAAGRGVSCSSSARVCSVRTQAKGGRAGRSTRLASGTLILEGAGGRGQPARPQGCLWTLGLQSSRLGHRKGCHVVWVTWDWGGPTPGACACRMAGRVPFRKKAGGLGGRPPTGWLPSHSRGCRSSSWGQLHL